jgi:hypothetical protein
MNGEKQGLTHRLQMHVERLAGDIGERNVFASEALQRAAVYIEDEWGTMGYDVERLEYDVSGIRCANLVTTRKGSARSSEILLLGAHYDSVIGSPGANDNASGVAALLEIARMFQAVEPVLTVRFVAFVNEEPPFFWTHKQGSMVYAEAARRRGDDIRLMASLETIGCYSDQPGSQSYPRYSASSIPTAGISLESYRISARDLRCSGLPRHFERSPTFRCRPFRLSGSFPEFHGATIDRSGATVIPP